MGTILWALASFLVAALVVWAVVAVIVEARTKRTRVTGLGVMPPTFVRRTLTLMRAQAREAKELVADVAWNMRGRIVTYARTRPMAFTTTLVIVVIWALCGVGLWLYTRASASAEPVRAFATAVDQPGYPVYETTDEGCRMDFWPTEKKVRVTCTLIAIGNAPEFTAVFPTYAGKRDKEFNYDLQVESGDSVVGITQVIVEIPGGKLTEHPFFTTFQARFFAPN